jgi:hypothetical protein
MTPTPSPTRRAAHFAFAALLAAGAGLFAFAAAPAHAADDKSTFGAILDVFGANIGESDEKIDYRERSRIVVPPNRAALPDPRSGDAARSADGRAWPVDQDIARRRAALAGARAPAPQPGLNQNPTLRPEEIAGRSPDAPRRAGDSECLNARNSRECLLMSAEDAKKGTVADTRTLVRAGEEPSRAFLTEPPTGYRRPTKDISATREVEEKVDLSNPLTYLRQQAGKVVGGN